MDKRKLNKIIKVAIKIKELSQAYGDPGIKKRASTVYEITKKLIQAQGKPPKQ